MIGTIIHYSNQDSHIHSTDRTAVMEAYPYFKPSVMGFKEPTSTSTMLRLFLSILIGHWGDEGLLTLLDQGMGKNYFGRRLDNPDMKPLRELLDDRYGPREDIDIEAILEEIKPDLSNLLSISQNYLGYDVTVTNGRYSGLSMKAIPSNKAS